MKKKMLFWLIATLCVALIVGGLLVNAGRIDYGLEPSSQTESTASANTASELVVSEEPILEIIPSVSEPIDSQDASIPAEEPEKEVFTHQWEFEKDWYVVTTACMDQFVANDMEVGLPFMQSRFWLLALPYKDIHGVYHGLEYLYHLSVSPRGELTAEALKEWEDAVAALGVPLERCTEDPVATIYENNYHTILSFNDAFELGKWCEDNGYPLFIDFCRCGAEEDHERALHEFPF